MFHYLLLFRINNSFTVISNIFAGYFLSQFFTDSQPNFFHLVFLCFTSFFLYTGGVILNDIVDLERDKKLHPERPLPVGKIKIKTASTIAICFIILATFFALLVNIFTLTLCIAIIFLITTYNFFTKKYKLPGSLNLGILRGFNFLLGTTPFHYHLLDFRFYLSYSLIVFIYIFLVSLISFYEEDYKKKLPIIFYISAIIISILIFALIMQFHFSSFFLIFSCIFLLFYSGMKFYKAPSSDSVSLCIRNGILGIIFVDSANLFGSSLFIPGVFVLMFILPSILLNKFLRIA